MTQEDACDLKISTSEGNAIETIVETIASGGGKIDAIGTLEPGLEDVFLTVTGKAMRDSVSIANARLSLATQMMGESKARVR